MFGWLILLLISISPISLISAEASSSTQPPITTKIAIIGGGPAGHSAAVGASKGGHEPVVIEGSVMTGAANRAGLITNYPGITDATGLEIVQKLRAHAKDLGAKLYPEETVESCNFKSKPFTLKTNKGQTVNCDTVLIATGTNPKKLYIPGETKFEGKGVAYCSTCDAPMFKNKDVLIVGGDHNALREVSTLKKFAKNITILTRKENFKAPQFLLNHLKLPNVKVVKKANVKEIMGTDKVTGVKAEMDNGEMEVFPTQGVFIALGWKPNTHVFKDHLKLDKDGKINVNCETFETSVPGVFAAGDCSTKSKHQMPASSGNGYNAYLSLEQYLKKLEAAPAS
jgi:thioredoxin reductase (NADPH)